MARPAVLVLVADDRIPPDDLAATVEALVARGSFVHVVLPVRVPPQLPVSADAGGALDRLWALDAAADRVLRAAGAQGEIEEVRCRSLLDVLAAVDPRKPVAAIVLLGRARRAVVRAAARLAPVVQLSSPRRLARPRRALGVSTVHRLLDSALPAAPSPA